tara:strand:+ start:54 stop:680 length:627 start_codon:yes stop_codon:yes gene_type:complete
MGYSIDSIYTKNYKLFELGKNPNRPDISINYFLTADISDVYLDEINEVINKRYLNSRADFYLNTYNNCSSNVNKFNNNKTTFRQKETLSMRCKSCENSSSSHNNDYTQKLIQNQVRVASSLYTMNLASLTGGNSTKNVKPWNNASDRVILKKDKGIDIKHNNYDRYLNRKKSNNLRTEQLLDPPTKPLYGNKVRKFGLITINNCKLNC